MYGEDRYQNGKTRQSALDKHYTAVLGTACIGLVVGNGFVRTFTHSLQVEAVNAHAFECLHHGTIRMVANENDGTEINISLPL